MADEQKILDMSADDVFENIDDAVDTVPDGVTGDQETPPAAEEGQGDDENVPDDAENTDGTGADGDGQEPDEGEGLETGENEEDAEGQEQPELTIEQLQQQLQELNEQLERERKGLLKGIKEEREKRQQLEGRLSQVSEFIASRQAARQDDDEPDADDETLQVGEDRIPIEYDDEGNAFVPASALKDLTTKQTQELQSKIDNLNAAIAQKQVIDQQTREVNAILQQDEGFPAALKSATEQSAYFDQLITEYVNENNLPRPNSVFEVIDMAMDAPEVMKAFSKKFPEADIEVTLEGLFSGSKTKFMKMLSAYKPKASEQAGGDADKAAADGKQGIKTLKALAKKPSNLSSTQNQRTGSSGITLESIAQMSQEDFEKLSDADVDRIEKLLAG